MPWARLHDGMTFHPKIIEAGNEAIGIWARALAHCNLHLTDGIVTSGVLRSIAAPGKRLETKRGPVGRLIEVGLLSLGPKGTFVIHDFLDWNDSKAEVLEKREKDAARKRQKRGQMSQRTEDGRRVPTPLPLHSTDLEGSDPAESEPVTLPEFQERIANAGIAISMSAPERERFSKLVPVRRFEVDNALGVSQGKGINRAAYLLSIIENDRMKAAAVKNKEAPPPARNRTQQHEPALTAEEAEAQRTFEDIMTTPDLKRRIRDGR